MKVLLAGETWISASTHYKGWDSFTTVSYENGGGQFCETLREGGIDVTQLPAHLVPMSFPRQMGELREFDVVILSDIGSNSILLAPETWSHGRASTNRLSLLREWVEGGGGLGMVGGYLSFQGLDGKARWRNTPVAEVLPVEMMAGDDRVEAPEGARPVIVQPEHPIVHGVDALPAFLGYNRLAVKEEAQLLAAVGGDPLLVTWNVGKGRTLAWSTDIGPHWCPDTASDSPALKQTWCQAVKWLAGSRGGGEDYEPTRAPGVEVSEVPR